MIAGFDGWGNALGMAQAMLDHLMGLFPSQPIAQLDSDVFFSYDESRPRIEISEGRLLNLDPPGGTFYLVTPDPGRPLILLKAHEPHLRWELFARVLVDFAAHFKVETLITLGSMYDSVLHTERVISALVAHDEMARRIQSDSIDLINYTGPSAVHTHIHAEAQERGLDAVSFWCHCPHYLQGAVHFGLLARLGRILGQWGQFSFDSTELEKNSQELNRQIDSLVETNPKLAGVIAELKKLRLSKGRRHFTMPAALKKTKVIDITQFLEPK
ncbi:MAG: PAC2 family protein [Desulfobacterales bacterium]